MGRTLIDQDIEISVGEDDDHTGLKLGVDGEAFWRIHITPQGLIQTGGGGSLPTTAAGTRYIAAVPGSGVGTVTVTHNLNSNDVHVTVRRITGSPLGEIALRWEPTGVNTISLDFDTYARASGEFRVMVSA